MKSGILSKNGTGNSKKRYTFLTDLSKNKAFLLMLLPGAIILILFSYMPMFGIVLAFKDFNLQKGFFGSDFIGLRNFKFLFATEDAYIITRNVILYNLVFIFAMFWQCLLQ